MSRCIECGWKLAPDKGEDYWFCSYTCAAYCCMFSAKKGWRTEDEALTMLTIRHKELDHEEDLKRIEKILEKQNQRSSSNVPVRRK